MKKENLSAPRKPSLLPFGLLFAAFVFLFTPNVNLFDLLPDSVGYGLLFLALRKMAEVFPHFDNALRGFRILFWVNLAKIPALFIMLYVAGINMEERGLITVFALSFAVVEWIFAIPAFRAFFEGFVYLGEREGVMTTLSLPGGGASVDKLTLLTLFFLIAKGACSFLPELVFLSTFFYNGSLDPGTINPVVFYPFLAVLGFAVALVFGLIWLVHSVAYLCAQAKSSQMRELLVQKQEAFSAHLQAKSDLRRKRVFLTLCFVGFFFAIDPLIGNRDLLPNALSALAFFAVFSLLGKTASSVFGKTASLLYCLASILLAVFRALFFAKFNYTDVAFRDVAAKAYTPVVIASAFEALLFLLSVFFLVRALEHFISENTGQDLRPHDLSLRNEVHVQLKKGAKRLFLLSLVYALFRPISLLLLVKTDRHIVTEDEANQFYAEGSVIYASQYAWIWIPVLLLGILLAAVAFSLTREVRTEAHLSEEEE